MMVGGSLENVCFLACGAVPHVPVARSWLGLGGQTDLGMNLRIHSPSCVLLWWDLLVRM